MYVVLWTDWFAYKGTDNVTMNQCVSPLPGENSRVCTNIKQYWQGNTILLKKSSFEELEKH